MAEKVRPLQELLPWLLPLSEQIVACKDSGLLACFEYRGIDTDGSPAAAVAQLEAVMDTAMATWRNQPATLWWTARREKTVDYPSAPMPDPISQMIDDEHREQFVEQGGYVNRYFVSVLWRPERSTNAVLDHIGTYMADNVNPIKAVVLGIRSALSSRESFAWDAASLEQALQAFEGRLAQFHGTLGVIAPRRLKGDELIGFLWGMANPGMSMVPKAMPRDARFMDGLLGERTVDVTRDMLVFGKDVPDTTYVSAISLKEYPDAFEAGAFDGLLTMPIEATLSIAFRVASTSQMDKELSAARRNANLTKFGLKSIIASAIRRGEPDESSADPSKLEALDDAAEAQAELSSGRRFWGWMNTTLTYYSNNFDEVERLTAEATRALHGSRFSGAVRETTHLVSAWTVTLPGAWEECRRWYPMTDANVSDTAPIVSVIPGERWNEHYSKITGRPQPALTVLATDYATPYYFNFNEGQIGHAFVVGPTRSGKSIGMNFFMSQFRKYPGARIVIFDRDLSCRIPTLLQGGEHIDVRPGGHIQLNPFVLVESREHWPFLARWTEYLASARGYQVTAEDTRQIWQAIEATAEDPDRSNRRLMGVYNLLPVHLKGQLNPWIEGNQYGEYFDHVEDSFSLSDFTCIEMGPVMQDPILASALMDYAFYRTELALRPRPGEPLHPTLMYVEECSFLMQVPQFANRLVGWLKTFAKLNGGVILTTQSPEDLQQSNVETAFAAIRDNIPTRVYLPNPNAMSEGLHHTYTRTFGLLPEQVERIAKALPKRQYFITKQGGVARMTSLHLTPNQVNALRSETDAQRIFDACWQNGTAPSGWQQEYMSRITAWDEHSQLPVGARKVA